MFDYDNANIVQVLAHVGDDPVEVQAALDHELTRAKPRKGLVEKLEARLPAEPSGPGNSPPAPPAAPEPAPLVRGRWIDVQAIDAVDQGVILYGEEFWATREQIDDPRSPVVAWDDDWTPDPTVLEQSRLFDADSPDEVPEGFVHNPREERD